MNLKKLCFCFSIIVYSLQSNAQVQLNSGASTFSLPIFSYSDHNKLNASVSLVYLDGNGLKVNEIPGIVGTGWAIQAGGVITREQRGEPDDQRRSLALPNPLAAIPYAPQQEYYDTYFPNGYLFTTFSPTDNITNEGAYVKMISGYGDLYVEKETHDTDRQQDIFKLDFGKGVIEFVIEKNLSVTMLNHQKIKVQVVIEDMLSSKIRTCISKFIVTDTDGTEYTFSAKELSQTLSYELKKYPTGEGYFALTETNYFPGTAGHFVDYPGSTIYEGWPVVFFGKRTNNYIVTKWFLVEAKNPRTNQKIKYNYESYDIDMPTGRQQTYYSYTASTTVNKEILNSFRLKSIETPHESNVEFIYEENLRVDVPGIKPLKEIRIIKNNIILNKFIFTYQYFFTSILKPYNYSFDANEKFMARLSLKSVQKIGKNGILSENPHQFEYYTGTSNYPGYHPSSSGGGVYISRQDIVPPIFSLNTDHWGYYNSMNMSRDYRAAYEYPINYSPGAIFIKWECMQTTLQKVPVAGMAKNGILKTITYPMGGSLTYDYEQNSAYHAGQNVYTGGVRVNKTIVYDGINHDKDMVKSFKYVKEDGTSSSGWGYEVPTYTLTKEKRIYKQSAGKSPRGMFKDFATSTLTNTLTSSFSSYTELLGNFGVALQQGIINLVVEFLISLFSSSPPEFTEDSEIEYHNTSYQYFNPLPSLYSRVEVSDLVGNTNVNGKTVYEFTSDSDLALLVPTLSFPYAKESRFHNSAYGLTKKTSTYDKTGFLLQQSIIDYETFTTAGSYSLTWAATKNVYDAFPSTHTSYLNESGNITKRLYVQYPNHTRITSSKEKIYSKLTSGYIESQVQYTYNANNLQIASQKYMTSKGYEIVTKNYYPQDYTYSTIPSLQNLVLANIIDEPISTETWQTKPGGNPELLSASITEHKTIASGDYAPYLTHTLQVQQPVPLATIGSFNPAMLIRNSTLLKPTIEFTYDSKNNPVQSKNVEENKFTSLMFGYDNEYPIATITNANTTEVAYCSFEETGNTGGWNITSANMIVMNAPTGKRCLSLSGSSIITSSIVMNKDYKLSFWANTSSSVTVSGITPYISSPTINGWTYYEYNVPSSSPTPIITGQGEIDELRLYPSSASMTTTTYEPGIGKTSECDMNNRIIYYQYDELGRKSKLLDSKQNIIQTYEYHQKN